MKKLLTLLAAITIALPCTYAQINAQKGVHRQRGVVRMITNTAGDPLTVVKGARVVIDGEPSDPTDAEGVFVKEVTGDFKVDAVRPEDKYLIAIPYKGKRYKRSNNDIDVVVTTKERRDRDYKKLYNRLLDKYDAQKDSVSRLLHQLERTRRELDRTSQEYARVTARLDNVRALNLEYINNADRIEEEIGKIADELALTDYQSLSDAEQRVYELRCAGDWEAVSRVINEVMRGDAAKMGASLRSAQVLNNQEVANLEQKLQQAKQKQQQGQLSIESYCRLMESNIESFVVRHLNDSASIYCTILTDAAPDNWDYLNAAGNFEGKYMAAYDKALDYYNRALATNPSARYQSASYNNIGEVYRKQGAYDQALEMYQKALDIDLATLGENHPDVATCYNGIGSVYCNQGDYDQAMEMFQKALDIWLSTYGDNHPTVALSYNNIGECYRYQGNYDNALEMHQKALDIELATLGKKHPHVAASYGNIGSVYGNKGDYDQALEMYQKALDIQLSILSGKHPDVATSYSNIGSIYFNQGSYDKSLEMYQKALDIELATFGENHPAVSRSYGDIGTVHYLLGNLKDAYEMIEKAYNIYKNLYGEDDEKTKINEGSLSKIAVYMNDNYKTAVYYSRIGYDYFKMGNYDKAVEILQQALDILLVSLGQNHNDVAKTYGNIGAAHYAKGDLKYAFEKIDKAYNIYKNLYGDEDENTMKCQKMLLQIAGEMNGGEAAE